MNSVVFSHKTDDWRTPSVIYDWFIENGYFDPCPFQHSVNGLLIPWREFNFVNPPYSDLISWVRKAIKERNYFNRFSVLLIPARTDTQAFKLLFEAGAYFLFVVGRMHFNDSKGTAPFPSCFVFLDPTRCFLRMDYVDRDLLPSHMGAFFRHG